MKQLQVYTYTIPAFGSVQIPAQNDNFIVQASTGMLAVRGDTFGKLTGIVAGQGLKMVPFNRLELIDESGAPNTVTILLAPVEFVNQVFSGSVNVVGTIPVDVVRAVPPAPSNWFNTNAAITFNTPQTVLAPGANINGAILLSAAVQASETARMDHGFLAKASAPALITDGEPLLHGLVTINTASFWSSCAQLSQPLYVAPGLGIYYISSLTLTAGTGTLRSARWQLL